MTMDTQVHSYVSDADDYSFQEKVIQRSMSVPVLVDCWAEWCEPCKTLGPTLETLAADYKGRFELVKVNIDQAQQVAMALRIQSVPFMILFIEGRPVDALVGNQPEQALKGFLDKHLPPMVGDPYEEGISALSEGLLDEAEALFDLALSEDNTRADALIARARIALMKGQTEIAEVMLNAVSEEDPLYPLAARLKALFAFAPFVSDEQELRGRIEEAQQKDATLWYQLGATQALKGNLEDACASFLRVVSLDRSYLDDGGRSALLTLLDALGGQGDVVSRYRRKLANLLF